jgi:hypothetical protein
MPEFLRPGQIGALLHQKNPPKPAAAGAAFPVVIRGPRLRCYPARECPVPGDRKGVPNRPGAF